MGDRLSQQRLWQLAKIEDGLCSLCGENPLGSRAEFCDECADRRNAQRRLRRAALKERTQLVNKSKKGLDKRRTA